MIYKLITWIEIYFISLQLPSRGRKSVLFTCSCNFQFSIIHFLASQLFVNLCGPMKEELPYCIEGFYLHFPITINVKGNSFLRSLS